MPLILHNLKLTFSGYCIQKVRSYKISYCYKKCSKACTKRMDRKIIKLAEKLIRVYAVRLGVLLEF